jgi:DNA-binding NtrC family response regulator
MLFYAMLTKTKLAESIKNQGRKKNWVAEQLSISRPTLDRKLKDNSFTDEETSKLKELGLV